MTSPLKVLDVERVAECALKLRLDRRPSQNELRHIKNRLSGMSPEVTEFVAHGQLPVGGIPKCATAEDINTILQTLVRLSDDGYVQLTVLGMALAIACRSCGVSPVDAVLHFQHLLAEPVELVPLENTSQ